MSSTQFKWFLFQLLYRVFPPSNPKTFYLFLISQSKCVFELFLVVYSPFSFLRLYCSEFTTGLGKVNAHTHTHRAHQLYARCGILTTYWNVQCKFINYDVEYMHQFECGGWRPAKTSGTRDRPTVEKRLLILMRIHGVKRRRKNHS